MAMLVYQRVCLFNDNALSLIKPMRGLDLLPAGVRLRRLAQAVAFDVRITWLLGVPRRHEHEPEKGKTMT